MFIVYIAFLVYTGREFDPDQINAAKKKAAQEKQARQFDPSRLFSGLSTKDLFSNEAKLGGRLATSFADTFSKPNKCFVSILFINIAQA